jgi:hypothetical protein
VSHAILLDIEPATMHSARAGPLLDGPYWPLLAPIDPYWPLLDPIAPLWTPIGPYWPPWDPRDPF